MPELPAPSKFTAPTRKAILEALQVGASRKTAAALARVGEATFRRWMEQGRTATKASRFRDFHEAVLEAEAHPRIRALGVIYNEIPNDVRTAWKFIERREPGFAPPMPNAPMPAGPVVINLTLSDGSLPALGGWVEGEVVEDESDGSTRSHRTFPAALPSA